MFNFFTAIKKNSLMIAILIIHSSLVVASDVCSDQEQKSFLAQKSGLEFDKFNWSVLNKKIILVADNHGFTAPEDIFSIISRLPQLTNKKSCIFFEFPSSIDIKVFRERLSIDPQDAEQKKYILYYRQLVELADNLNLQVHLVDHPDHYKIEQTVDSRNTAMVQNIKKLLDNSQCDLGVQIVGEAHIAPDDKTFNSIRSKFLEHGIENLALTIIYTQKSFPTQQLNKWFSNCPIQSYTPKNSIIFPTELIKNLTIWPMYSETATFGYFDFAILFPK